MADQASTLIIACGAIAHELIAVTRANRLAQLVRSTDEFFISQAGQWLAVGVGSDRFAQTLKDGWRKINKLSGT